MEQKFKSLSLFEFQFRFPDDATCQAYLADLKWVSGYQCQKCGHKSIVVAKMPLTGNAPAAITWKRLRRAPCFIIASFLF
jgi:DNA-directed RNA polymerase subunit RPC12/RpoP